MDPSEWKHLWASTGNRIPEETLRAYVSHAIARAEHERARRKRTLLFATVWLGLITSNALWQLMQRRIGVEAWSIYALMTVQWIVVIRIFQLHRKDEGRWATSIRPSLERLHHRTLTRIRELAALLALFLIAAPLLYGALAYLQESGKMRPHEAVSAGALGALVLIAGAAYVAYELFGRAKPELRQLTSLLNAYGQGS